MIVRTARSLGHRRKLLWQAALVHRLSGLGLAIFLPFHFLALGLAINGQAKLEGFLRWTDAPVVKLVEGVLIFLLAVHLLGGLRLLLVENLPWFSGQKLFAATAAALSVVVAFAFLVAVF